MFLSLMVVAPTLGSRSCNVVRIQDCAFICIRREEFLGDQTPCRQIMSQRKDTSQHVHAAHSVWLTIIIVEPGKSFGSAVLQVVAVRVGGTNYDRLLLLSCLNRCINICAELYYPARDRNTSCGAAAWNGPSKQCYLKTHKSKPMAKKGDISFVLKAPAAV